MEMLEQGPEPNEEQPDEVYTVIKNDDGSTAVAHLPSVHESASPLATQMREKRARQQSAAVVGREVVRNRIYRLTSH